MKDYFNARLQPESSGLTEAEPASAECGRVVPGDMTAPIAAAGSVATRSAFARPQLRCDYFVATLDGAWYRV